MGPTAESPEEVTFVGTTGTLTLRPPAHCPTALLLRSKASGRGGGGGEPEEYFEPLPAEPAAVRDAGGFIMPNSIGFAYEAAAVAEAIASGRRSCAQWTPAESLKTMAVVEAWREQVHGLSREH